MLKIIDNDIRRGTEKIGWIDGNDIFDSETGRKLGYTKSNDIYDANSRKLGYIEGNFLFTQDDHKIPLDDNRRAISGGSCSDLMRAAIRLLLGE